MSRNGSPGQRSCRSSTLQVPRRLVDSSLSQLLRGEPLCRQVAHPHRSPPTTDFHSAAPTPGHSGRRQPWAYRRSAPPASRWSSQRRWSSSPSAFSARPTHAPAAAASGPSSPPFGRLANSNVRSPLPAQRNRKGKGGARGGRFSSAARSIATRPLPEQRPVPRPPQKHNRTSPRTPAAHRVHVSF